MSNPATPPSLAHLHQKPIQRYFLNLIVTSFVMMTTLLSGCNEGAGADGTDGESGNATFELEKIKVKTSKEYPTISHVSPNQVGQWLNDEKQTPVVLDVREAAEFNVSHLKAATQIQPGAAVNSLKQTALKGVGKDQRIVLYCSVGVRSAIMTKRLKDAGYTNVHNMNGSIFQWANEDRKVYRNEKPVDKVHPYNKEWGRLLKKSRRADVPDVDG